VRSHILILACALLVGCGTMQAPRRTLPERIETIHIPMPRNDSYEYGYEEGLARHLHQEFMADGRLRPTRAQLADARLDTTIRRVGRSTIALNRDDYPLTDQVIMSVDLVLWEAGRTEPTLDLRGVEGSTTFMSDPRRNQFSPEPEWQEELLEDMALAIVQEVLTGEIRESDEDLAVDDAEPAGPEINLDQDPDQAVPSIRMAPGR
jgi:hypothetical protein